MFKRSIQIAVVGSAADLQYGKQLEEQANELGLILARKGYTLIFGAEKDCDSLPTIAARAACSNDGLTVGVTYDKGLEVYDNQACTVVVATGLIRGGGREMVQGLSSDGVIALAGGSGTLNEIAVAYQAGIPVVCVDGFGGWSQDLAGSYLDARERYRFGRAENAERAVEELEKMIWATWRDEPRC